MKKTAENSIEKPSKKAPDIIKEIAGSCLGVRIRLINRIISSIFDEELRPHGLKGSQMNVLVAVSAFGPVTSKHLCSVLHMDSSTLSRALKRLIDSGFLNSIPSGDGKIRLIHSTQTGIQKIESVYPHWLRAQKRTQEVLGENAAETLSSAGSKYLLEGMTS